MKNQFRKTCLLLSQELSILYENCLNDVSLTIAYSLAFQFKDHYEDEDELYNNVTSIHAVLSPLISTMVPYSSAFSDAIENSNVIDLALEEEINTVLTYKKEIENFTSSVFNPYVEDDVNCLKELFYRRLLRTLRVRFILKDIREGIEEYGLDAYKTCFEDSINMLPLPLDNPDTMDFNDVMKETKHLLSYEIQDTMDDIDNLKNLSALCVSFDQIKGEK